jgi:small subunit ribosomal protein S4
MIQKSQCKICRRFGQKLFLKGERCFSAKCAMIKRPYGPGRQGRSSNRRKISDYGQQLSEKQKLRFWYNLSEKQFRRYISEALKKSKQSVSPVEGLIQRLECRLDNVIYRAGWAESRIQARQLVVHGHFRVNNRSVDRPSFSVTPDDVITIKENHQSKSVFKGLGDKKEKSSICPWMKVDFKKMEATLLRLPSLEEVNPPAQVSVILEFYTR